MKESYHFRPIAEGLKKKKEAALPQPLTSAEYEDAEQQPMTLTDHWLSLRQSIQENITIEKPTVEEQERTKELTELLTPELMTGYKNIEKEFDRLARKSDDHLRREFIDMDAEGLSDVIEKWIDALIQEVQCKRGADFSEDDSDELRAQCWLFFDSLGNVMNTKSLENDIVDFDKEHRTDGSDEKERQKQKSALVAELQDRYPFDKAELGILVDLVRAEKGAKETYSTKILVDTIARLWGEYKLGSKKGALTKISLGYLLSKGAESFAPSLFQNIIANDKFNVAVFLEYFGLNKVSEVLNAKTDVELARVMNDINHQINERITNSLFFQEFEFIHEKSLGEVFSTLERGKKSTERLLEGAISKLVPTLAGIGMSLAFLMRINPILGAIGIGSLPMMYRIAKKQNDQIWPMYEKERSEGEKISTRVGSIKGGFEEVKTSPESPSVALHLKEQMDAKDTLSAQRAIEEAKMRLLRLIPFDVSTVAAAAVGGVLQEAGMISGGAVLSNILYSSQLNRPVQELVNLYFNQFSLFIQDIQRMDEILGAYEKLDLPEGEKEKSRVPVSALESLDISMRNVHYKDILRGVNIDIRQGEFVTIAGASGAGKSTVLRTLVGLYKPDGGHIEIGGVRNDEIKKYGKESLYSVMSYCNQSPQFFEGMTLRENLLLWSKSDVGEEKIKKVLSDLHLDAFMGKLDQEVKHLSGGEKVRFGVARTLIKGAKIMLLDEPTASLDSHAATEVRTIISELHDKYPDTTIICVSHDEELIKISSRVVRMEELQK